jgi:hypothetical protein
MARVCLVGTEDISLQYELLSRETSRNALAAYDIEEPFHNSIAVETLSLGAAVALLNDLDWYLVRFVDIALVKEPSVSETDWLSRELATAIRDDEVSPAESGRFLKVYGLEQAGDSPGPADTESESNASNATSEASESDTQDAQYRLVEPMLVARTGETVPEYDIRDVEKTLTVRVTESEFGA